MTREIKFQVILDNKIVGYERLSDDGWQWMWIDLNPDKGERWVSGVMQTETKSRLIRRIFTVTERKSTNQI